MATSFQTIPIVAPWNPAGIAEGGSRRCPTPLPTALVTNVTLGNGAFRSRSGEILDRLSFPPLRRTTRHSDRSEELPRLDLNQEPCDKKDTWFRC